MPEWSYSSFQVIEAVSEQEAEDEYNRINNCSFFYETVIGQLVNNEVLYERWFKNKLKIDDNREVDYSSAENYDYRYSELIERCIKEHNTLTRRLK